MMKIVGHGGGQVTLLRSRRDLYCFCWPQALVSMTNMVAIMRINQGVCKCVTKDWEPCELHISSRR